MGRFIFPVFILAAALMLTSLPGVAQAERQGLSLSQTRVVFDAAKPGVATSLRNHSDRPWLVRAQVVTKPGGVQAAQLMVTPPLFRLEPESQNTVRIMRKGSTTLPVDRESVFYLSFLAIPSSRESSEKESTDVSARVTVGVDTVIKLFYRPTGLKLGSQMAAQKLTVHSQGNGVTIINPTPYYQTLASFSLDGKPVDIRQKESMIAPFDSSHYQASGQPRKASWSVINDYGGISPVYHTAVSAGEGH
ncbi:TPA: molecular chaperone [Enterobacter cloacae]|nr:molecular chaperone [Enterobacter cloacae]